MPRKKAEPQAAPANDLMDSARQPLLNPGATDAMLMERYFSLKDWITGEDKRFAEYMKPHRDEMSGIEQEFLTRLNDRGADSTKSDFGTAYKSTLLNVSVSPEGAPYAVENNAEPLVGRDALLEACLDHWAEFGSDMLMISPQKDAVKRYMDEHDGHPPPGIKTAFYTRVNIRRS